MPEDRLLRRLYADGLPIGQISAHLGRSPDAIVARRRALGVPPRRPRAWPPLEEALLRAATSAGVSAPVLARRLGRSPDQVRARRRRLLGRTRAPARPYLASEDEAMCSPQVSNGDLIALAGRLGRAPDALRLRAQALGVYDPPRRHRWTEWEDAVVRDGYTDARPCAEIACQLPHRSPASVAARARKLGLGSYARRWRTQDDRRLRQLTAAACTLEARAPRRGEVDDPRRGCRPRRRAAPRSVDRPAGALRAAPRCGSTARARSCPVALGGVIALTLLQAPL